MINHRAYQLKINFFSPALTILSLIFTSISVFSWSPPAAATMLRFNYDVQGFANDDGFTDGILSFQLQGIVRDVFPRSQTLDITDYRATFRSEMGTITHGIDDLFRLSDIFFRLEPGDRLNDVSVFFVQLSSSRDNVDLFLSNPGEGFFSSVIIDGQFRGCDPLFGPPCNVSRTVQRVPLDI